MITVRHDGLALTVRRCYSRGEETLATSARVYAYTRAERPAHPRHRTTGYPDSDSLRMAAARADAALHVPTAAPKRAVCVHHHTTDGHVYYTLRIEETCSDGSSASAETSPHELPDSVVVTALKQQIKASTSSARSTTIVKRFSEFASLDRALRKQRSGAGGTLADSDRSLTDGPRLEDAGGPSQRAQTLARYLTHALRHPLVMLTPTFHQFIDADASASGGDVAEMSLSLAPSYDDTRVYFVSAHEIGSKVYYLFELPVDGIHEDGEGTF